MPRARRRSGQPKMARQSRRGGSSCDRYYYGDEDLLGRMLLMYAAPAEVTDAEIPAVVPTEKAREWLEAIISQADDEDKWAFATLTMRGRGIPEVRHDHEWCVRAVVREGTDGGFLPCLAAIVEGMAGVESEDERSDEDSDADESEDDSDDDGYESGDQWDADEDGSDTDEDDLDDDESGDQWDADDDDSDNDGSGDEWFDRDTSETELPEDDADCDEPSEDEWSKADEDASPESDDEWSVGDEDELSEGDEDGCSLRSNAEYNSHLGESGRQPKRGRNPRSVLDSNSGEIRSPTISGVGAKESSHGESGETRSKTNSGVGAEEESVAVASATPESSRGDSGETRSTTTSGEGAEEQSTASAATASSHGDGPSDGEASPDEARLVALKLAGACVELWVWELSLPEVFKHLAAAYNDAKAEERELLRVLTEAKRAAQTEAIRAVMNIGYSPDDRSEAGAIGAEAEAIDGAKTCGVTASDNAEAGTGDGAQAGVDGAAKAAVADRAKAAVADKAKAAVGDAKAAVGDEAKVPPERGRADRQPTGTKASECAVGDEAEDAAGGAAPGIAKAAVAEVANAGDRAKAAVDRAEDAVGDEAKDAAGEAARGEAEDAASDRREAEAPPERGRADSANRPPGVPGKRERIKGASTGMLPADSANRPPGVPGERERIEGASTGMPPASGPADGRDPSPSGSMAARERVEDAPAGGPDASGPADGRDASSTTATVASGTTTARERVGDAPAGGPDASSTTVAGGRGTKAPIKRGPPGVTVDRRMTASVTVVTECRSAGVPSARSVAADVASREVPGQYQPAGVNGERVLAATSGLETEGPAGVGAVTWAAKAAEGPAGVGA
ncbi:hypothetical protein ACHAWF_014185, partial [Thalassiosira exigua]